MIRKRPSDPGFHPSKDTPHWANDTTAEGQGVMLDLGEEPARLDLFGAQGEHPRNESRLVPPPDSPGLQSEVKKLGGTTRVPVADWRMGRGFINLSHSDDDRAPGSYTQAFNGEAPKIEMTKRFRPGTTETLVHEMGHAIHFEQPMIGGRGERSNETRQYQDQRGYQPDPLQEAVADAYVDRYGGSVSAHNKIADRHASNVRDWETMKAAPGFEGMPDGGEVPEPKPYAHISDRQFGYSSQYEVEAGANAAWDDPDRVLYAGVRAHFDATGEIPHYQRSPNRTEGLVGGHPYTYPGSRGSSTDATIAMLHEHSEHARAAWSNLTIGGEKGPKREMPGVVADAVRRHKDRQLVEHGQEIQESLWGEPELARNQHGERPRTKAEVNNTLGNEPYAPHRLNVDS